MPTPATDNIASTHDQGTAQTSDIIAISIEPELGLSAKERAMVNSGGTHLSSRVELLLQNLRTLDKSSIQGTAITAVSELLTDALLVMRALQQYNDHSNTKTSVADPLLASIDGMIIGLSVALGRLLVYRATAYMVEESHMQKAMTYIQEQRPESLTDAPAVLQGDDVVDESVAMIKSKRTPTTLVTLSSSGGTALSDSAKKQLGQVVDRLTGKERALGKKMLEEFDVNITLDTESLYVAISACADKNQDELLSTLVKNCNHDVYGHAAEHAISTSVAADTLQEQITGCRVGAYDNSMVATIIFCLGGVASMVLCFYQWQHREDYAEPVQNPRSQLLSFFIDIGSLIASIAVRCLSNALPRASRTFFDSVKKANCVTIHVSDEVYSQHLEQLTARYAELLKSPGVMRQQEKSLVASALKATGKTARQKKTAVMCKEIVTAAAPAVMAFANLGRLVDTVRHGHYCCEPQAPSIASRLAAGYPIARCLVPVLYISLGVANAFGLAGRARACMTTGASISLPENSGSNKAIADTIGKFAIPRDIAMQLKAVLESDEHSREQVAELLVMMRKKWPQRKSAALLDKVAEIVHRLEQPVLAGIILLIGMPMAGSVLEGVAGLSGQLPADCMGETPDNNTYMHTTAAYTPDHSAYMSTTAGLMSPQCPSVLASNAYMVCKTLACSAVSLVAIGSLIKTACDWRGKIYGKCTGTSSKPPQEGPSGSMVCATSIASQRADAIAQAMERKG